MKIDVRVENIYTFLIEEWLSMGSTCRYFESTIK